MSGLRGGVGFEDDDGGGVIVCVGEAEVYGLYGEVAGDGSGVVCEEDGGLA